MNLLGIFFTKLDVYLLLFHIVKLNPFCTSLSKILNRKLSLIDVLKVIVITSHVPAPLYDNHGILTMSIYDFLLNPVTLGI